MDYYYRNTETDFILWCQKYVYRASIDVRDCVGGVLTEEQYRAALKITRQYQLLLYSLNPAQKEYLERYIIGRENPPYKPASIHLYRSIFENWSKICFPKGKIGIKQVDPMLLGGELRHQRLIKGLSVVKTAGLIGISAKTLYAYEDGTRMVSLNAFYALCQILKIDPNALLEETAIWC